MQIARNLAVSYPVVSITSAPRLAVSVLGAYTQTLPCLIGETAEMGCVNEMIAVREILGLHFCPAASRRCRAPSTRRERFGSASRSQTRSWQRHERRVRLGVVG